MPTSSPPPNESRPKVVPPTAWLLLLLRDGESYGRALLGELHARGIHLESGQAYRILRTLDHDGAITSRWTPSDGGPHRRNYRLTAEGRRTLAELTVGIAAGWRVHDAFLRAYERVHDEHGPPAGSRPDRTDRTDRAGTRSGRLREVEPRVPGEDANRPRTRPPDLAAVGRTLLTGWLLLLLKAGASYGYELRHGLQVHQVHVDSGAMYRALRRLERDGSLRSRWMRSPAGPRRRLYELTPDGSHSLDERVAHVAAIRDLHRAFLDAYDRPDGRPGHPPPPHATPRSP